MYHWIPFWPRTAAVNGDVVNALYIAELAVCGLILTTVVGMMFTFCVRYRAGSTASRADLTEKTWEWEIGWTTATLVMFLIGFVWGAEVYIWLYKSPPGDLEVFVVGKQWMWKIQHPGGQREIDALHLPVGKTVRLVLASQDVIHSFFIPAFRIKHDVVPGQYETFVVQADQARHLPARMLGILRHRARPHDRRGRRDGARPITRAGSGPGRPLSLAQQGAALFREHGCSGCHGAGSTVHARRSPGSMAVSCHLQDGPAVRADERYLRDCILLPRTHLPSPATRR